MNGLKELRELCHRGLDVPAFVATAGPVLEQTAPFDGCCWLTLDPATMLPTSHIPIASIRSEDVAHLATNEYEQDDVNKFAVLARTPTPVATLRRATGGDPERSLRYREILRPNGFENELRATLMDRGAAWGGVALYRAGDRPDFDEQHTQSIAEIGPLIAEGLRRAILISAVPTEQTEDGPGLLLLGPDNSIEEMSPAARRWLSELDFISAGPADAHLSNVVLAVAGRARLLAQGEEDAGGAVARARVRTASGVWLVLHGSLLGNTTDGRAAVIIEPARPTQIAPLIADAYALTERERDVTQLILQGLSTDEIAKTIFVSPYTVQDHLKVIFEKVGVRSRRELVAQIFFQHYAPRMGTGDNLSASGWFAQRSPA